MTRPKRAPARRSIYDVLFLLLFGFPMPVAAQPTPAVPSLESYDAQMQQRRGADGASQALPKSMTVCADRTTRRCWTEAGVTACETEGGTAEVFAVVTVGEDNSDAAAGLERCWSKMKGLGRTTR